LVESLVPRGVGAGGYGREWRCTAAVMSRLGRARPGRLSGLPAAEAGGIFCWLCWLGQPGEAMRTVLQRSSSPRPGVRGPALPGAPQSQAVARDTRLPSLRCACGRHHVPSRSWLLCCMPCISADPSGTPGAVAAQGRHAHGVLMRPFSNKIARAIHGQEKIGLDMLVHGEFERHARCQRC
jgi:hypothetical protein